MKVGLVDADSHNWPNLCLMKLSAYHKAQLLRDLGFFLIEGVQHRGLLHRLLPTGGNALHCPLVLAHNGAVDSLPHILCDHGVVVETGRLV